MLWGLGITFIIGKSHAIGVNYYKNGSLGLESTELENVQFA